LFPGCTPSFQKSRTLLRFFDLIPETGYEVIPIRTAHLNTYRSLPMHHRDPFDRILVAQAQAEALTLITRDPDIAKYDVSRLVC
jgi:PIN domain nuclease of toxin-antitoxin system